MSRTFQFRFWDKVLGQWFTPAQVELDAKGKIYSIRIGAKSFGLDRFEVNQFTGITDTKGVPVFEGDIVKAEPNRQGPKDNPSFYAGEIMYGSKFGTFGITDDRFKYLEPDRSAYLLTYYREHIEVIGNIFENPDLITPAK